jgi:GntR family transcriptional regulator, arabinose operon transcriptional repressor
MNNLKAMPGKKRRLSEMIRDQIIADMLSANLQPGDRYATEDELTQRFGVSRNTIRKAMSELEDAGFLVRRQRVGAIVTQKACTGRINIHSTQNTSTAVSTQASKIILVLPRWEAGTGNYFSNIVLRELSNTKDGQRKIIVEIRLFDDPLDDLNNDVQAILIVDPTQQMIPALAHWSQKGIKIIAIETQNPLYMAINIRFDIYQSAYDAVKLLYKQGHRRIGLINQDVSHNTFQQWLLGYLAAHQDLSLPVLPHAILQIMNKRANKTEKLNNISGWICSYNTGVDVIAQACHKQGLKIPDDVAIIGADDPGDIIVSSLGCSLTVVRPDYITLSKIVRQILDQDITAKNGALIDSPMKWIHRESTEKTF